MADYTQQTWTDDDGSGTVGTPITKARMDTIEAGVKDAAEHHVRVTSLPTADAAHKHWIVILDTSGGVQGQMYYCDGSSWTKIGQPEDASVIDITDPDASKATLGSSGAIVGFGNAGANKIAFKFTPGADFTLTKATLPLSRGSDLSSDPDSGVSLVVKVLNDNSGAPGATNLGQTSIPLYKLTSSPTGSSTTNIGIALPNVALTGGTSYWIELSLSTGTGSLYISRGTSGGAGSSTWNGSSWSSNGFNLAYDLRQGTEDWAVTGKNQSPRSGGGAMRAESATGFALRGISTNGIAVQGEIDRGQAFHGVAHMGSVYRARRSASDSEADFFRGENESGTPLFRVNKDGLIVALDPWHKIGAAGEPTFASGFDHFRDVTAGWAEYVAFRKMPDGTIRLKGLVAITSSYTAFARIFTLPAAYRPNRTLSFPVFSSVDGGVSASVHRVFIAGSVSQIAGSAGDVLFDTSAASGGNIGLDAVSFVVGDGTTA